MDSRAAEWLRGFGDSARVVQRAIRVGGRAYGADVVGRVLATLETVGGCRRGWSAGYILGLRSAFGSPAIVRRAR